MVKASSLIFLLLLFTTSYSQTWVLKWSDEFNEGVLDTTKWTYDIGNNNGWGNKELEYYTNWGSNVYLTNGSLVIQANNDGYDGFNYTSGRITTLGLFGTTYGKVEISAQLPFGQGIWPAFWMLGTNLETVGWPTCGDIDIMELIGDDPTQIHGSLHGPGYDATQTYNDSEGFSSSFHSIGIIWEPSGVQYYVDRNIYASFPNSTAGNNTWEFNHDFFIILNLAVGGSWPGSPNATTTFPQKFIIDYVRVWELQSDAEEGENGLEMGGESENESGIVEEGGVEDSYSKWLFMQ